MVNARQPGTCAREVYGACGHAYPDPATDIVCDMASNDAACTGTVDGRTGFVFGAVSLLESADCPGLLAATADSLVRLAIIFEKWRERTVPHSPGKFPCCCATRSDCGR